MRSSKNNQGAWIVLLGVTLALSAYLVATRTQISDVAQASPLMNRDPVNGAWQRAQKSGVYHFATTVVETRYPAPTVANVGRSSRQERIYLEGDVNQPERALQMMLWQSGGNLVQSRDGVEVRIAGEQAYGRQIGGLWQEIDDFSGAFAPANDLMAYLVGAKNVRQIANSNLQMADNASQFAIRNSQFAIRL